MDLDAIVRAFAAEEPLAMSTDEMGMVCLYCQGGAEPAGYIYDRHLQFVDEGRPYIHASECPWLAAKAAVRPQAH